MNKIDRGRIDRLYSLINAVPMPASGMGMHTGSIAGFALYAEDMRVLLPAIQAVLLGIMALESGNGDLEEGVDYKHPDDFIRAIEEWVETRKREGWGPMSTTPQSIYELARLNL